MIQKPVKSKQSIGTYYQNMAVTPAIRMTYLIALPSAMLTKLIQKLARIRPKAMVIAEPRIGRKAKNPIQAPCPAMKCWALSMSRLLTWR